MSTFYEGPAHGYSMPLRRAPICLRVVITKAGGIDALDQLSDQARPQEQIFVYLLMGVPSTVHMKMARRSESGWYQNGMYLFWREGPEETRDNTTWPKWLELHRREIDAFRVDNAERFLRSHLAPKMNLSPASAINPPAQAETQKE